MIIYKQITVNNLSDFKGSPATVMVLEGGEMAWPKGQRRIGIIVSTLFRTSLGPNNYKFKIVWMDGVEGNYYDSVKEMIITRHLDTSFFYVEIKNKKHDKSSNH